MSHINTFFLISLALTFIDLNPYRKSELTRLFHLFYNKKQLENILPYLKNCSISGVFQEHSSKISDEVRFVVYSTIVFSWAIGFAHFSLSLIIDNFSSLFLQIQIAPMLSKVSAAIILGSMLFTFAYLAFDLMHTFYKNILTPLLGPVLSFKRKEKEAKLQNINKEEVHKKLSQHMVFRSLSTQALDYLVENSFIKKMKKGSHLIIQGEVKRDVFFLISGEVEVNKRDKLGLVKPLATLSAPTLIGERSIIDSSPRNSNIRVTQDSTYLHIPANVFEFLFSQKEFSDDAKKLKSQIQISQFISSASIFKNLPDEVINLFIKSGNLTNFPANHHIVKEKEKDKTFYLIVQGSVDVIKNKNVIATLKQGDFFGEIALLSDIPRTADVKTKEDCLLLFIEAQDFWKVLSQNIEVALFIEAAGKNRMKANQDNETNIEVDKVEDAA